MVPGLDRTVDNLELHLVTWSRVVHIECPVDKNNLWADHTHIHTELAIPGPQGGGIS